jgi:hypothetical protein
VLGFATTLSIVIPRLITTKAVVVLTQFTLLVPVTEYRVVAPGNALTLAPTVLDKPAAGTHVYVEAPLAVSATADPPGTQMLVLDGLTLRTGNGFTVKVASLDTADNDAAEQVAVST